MILVIVVVILVGVAGYFAFIKKSEPITQQPSPTQTKTSVSPAPTSKNETANWKTYANAQYGFEFKYPTNFTIEDARNTQSVMAGQFGILNADGSYQGEIDTFESDFYHPTTNDVRSWVASHGNQYETYSDGEFSNKIGSDYKIDSLSTLHLLQNTAQGGTYDEFYVIKNNRLFRILVEPEDNPTTSSRMHQNLNLNDSAKWYNTFLQSFKFTK